MDNSDSKDTQGELELLFPAELVAEAIRSGPYKTSANAVAELVDNSYDAHAKEIHVALVCGADNNQPHTIAVLDNGIGMDENTLRHCIQYGSHQARETRRSRIGKFGVGLLSASFNQCQDLEVYSWVNGLGEQANSTRITVKNCSSTLPEVEVKPLPDFFDAAFSSFDRENTGLDTHGTLVVWRELDKMTWKRADKLREHLQREVGRIYRKFLADGSLKIVINIINQTGDGFTDGKEIFVSPVDPLFLSHWKCDELDQYVKDLNVVAKEPGKYGVKKDKVDLALDQKTLFVPFDFENETDNATSEDGTVKQVEYTVFDEVDKKKVIGTYRIIASYRRPQIVRAAAHAGSGSPRNPGDAKYGKLAEKLRGVSIMRGGRELTLDTNWLRADLTIDRWVALSLDFDPSLDVLFGVSNDKQLAKNLASLAQVNIDDDIKEDYNPTVLEAAEKVHTIISRMRRLVNRLDSPRHVKPDNKRPTDPAHEDIQVIRFISGKLQERSKDNPDVTVQGIDDQDLDTEKLVEGLKGATFENELASVVRPKILQDYNLKYDIVSDPSSGGPDMFIPINNASGAMIIRLNTEHPLYHTLQHIIGADEDEENGHDEQDSQQLQEKLDKTLTTIRRLIVSYSRAELEVATSVQKKDLYENMRREWSKIARDLFEEE